LDLTNQLDDIRRVISVTCSDDDDDGDATSPDKPSVDPYIAAASELYSSAFFGRQDPEAWLKRFLPIIAGVTKYRNGTTPKSKGTSVTFWEAVDIISGDLAGQTVSQVIRTVHEALVRLLIIRHLLASIFKEHLDVLIYLLKHRSALGAPPEGVDESKHYIASVTFKETKYTTSDISFFIKIRNLIASTERLEDKKRHNSDADSPLVLAFVSPKTSVLASPSATESGKRRKITSPSGKAKVYPGAMELFCSNGEDAIDD
jgi:hypothetical protein